MTALRLVLVRHGVTDWNREGRFQGHRDPGLSDAGGREAQLVAARIATDERLRPRRIIASSLGRALQTAEPIGSATGIPVEADPRLMEIGQGEWEGRTHAELEVQDAERYHAWRQAAGIRQPPGGEPIETATARVRALVASLEQGPPEDGSPICLVSHGGTLRILAHLLLELDATHGLDVDNASVGVVSRGSGWRLDRWNDTLHLLGHETTHVDEVEGRPLAL